MLTNHPTLRYIGSRGIWYLATLIVAIAINFFLPRLGTANPVDVIMGKVASGLSTEAAKEKEEAYLKEFGLVETNNLGEIVRDSESHPIKASLLTQFGSYLWMTLQGDLGTSFLNYPKKVSTIVAEAVPWTLALQFPTIVLGWIIGNLIGALAAYKRGVVDGLFFPLSLLSCSIPFFAFGMLLVYQFAIIWEFFPATGGYANDVMQGFTWEFISSVAYHYTLPFLSIFPVLAGGMAIGMRSMAIYELGTDYIKYSQWLGIKESRIVLYVFRNAMLPQLTGLALSLGMMIGGALITELIFSYPGLGTAMLKAIEGNDYPMIQGCTLLIAITVLIANFTVDVLIGILDPRVKAGQAL
ncbi:MAG: ABC transporter permease [Nannocystaceae bacterium]